MADGDDRARFRATLPPGADRRDVLALARALALRAGAQECRVHAAPPEASRVARSLAREHRLGLAVRVERKTPASIPDVLLRGDADDVMLYLREPGRFDCTLSANRRRGYTGLTLSGTYGVSHADTDAFYFSRIELCRRVRALLAEPPRVSHPLVFTTLELEHGSFARLALDPVLCEGFARYMLVATVGLDHGAELAHSDFSAASDVQACTILPAIQDAGVLTALPGCFAPDAPLRVEWRGATLAREPGEWRIDAIEARCAADVDALEMTVRYHRTPMGAMQSQLQELGGLPVERLPE